MPTRQIIQVIFWTLLVVLSGCGTTSVYVLNEREVVRVKAGNTVTAEFNGWLLSDRAVNRVMNAKIKDVNLE